MLKPPTYQPLSELDQFIFDATVPQDHYLRRVLQAVPFERFRPCQLVARKAGWAGRRRGGPSRQG